MFMLILLVYRVILSFAMIELEDDKRKNIRWRGYLLAQASRSLILPLPPVLWLLHMIQQDKGHSYREIVSLAP